MGMKQRDIMHEAPQPYLRRVRSVLDVGPGIRPQDIVETDTTLCVEPHDEYVEVLTKLGLRVIQATALQAINLIDSIDTVVALDVIEHMERAEGEAFVQRALEVAREQVVIFTPDGFLEQPAIDAWGMNGGYWQQHRSGWTPKDFHGWQIVRLPQFHPNGRGAFYAIHG